MATNANKYLVNIVPLQGISLGINNTDTAGKITSLETSVANIQEIVNYDTKTISADYINSFTSGNTIQFTSDVNISTGSLYINGNTYSNSNSSTLQFTKSSYISGTQSTISFVTAGNDVLKITSTGMLQYTSSPTYLSTGVQIGGFVYVSENAYVKTLYQASDRNKLTNIRPFSTILDNILELKPCSFNWISSGEADIGFIAQDVYTSWPNLTSEGNNIAYSRFIPLLLEGLRELRDRVRVLEGLSGGRA
jgi:hypothetical protein